MFSRPSSFRLTHHRSIRIYIRRYTWVSRNGPWSVGRIPVREGRPWFSASCSGTEFVLGAITGGNPRGMRSTYGTVENHVRCVVSGRARYCYTRTGTEAIYFPYSMVVTRRRSTRFSPRRSQRIAKRPPREQTSAVYFYRSTFTNRARVAETKRPGCSARNRIYAIR